MLKFILLILLMSHETFAFRFKVITKKVGLAEITFVHNADKEEKVYNLKASFADVERLAPLNQQTLKNLQSADLRSLSMEEFNQIYARVRSGPMPLGDYAAYVLQKPPIYYTIKKRISKNFLGFNALMKVSRQTCGQEIDDCLFEFIWKGKRFSAADDMDQIEALNLISAGLKIFPMHTYCGISQVDTRRESIIVDAAFADDFSSYISVRDEMVTRKGLNISEEYRMLRPGLYIGKVYTNKLFLFNVVLEKTGSLQQTETKDACLDTIKDL